MIGTRSRVTQPACGFRPSGHRPGTWNSAGGLGPAAGTCDVRCDPTGVGRVTRPDDAPDAALAQSVFEELGRLSFAEHSLESFLQRVTDAAAGVLPGRPSASVTVLRRGAPSTVAASDPLAAV